MSRMKNKNREKRKKKAAALVIAALIPLGLSAGVNRIKYYDHQPHLKNIIKGPFEILAIYTENGKTITITSGMEDRICGSIEDLEKYLAKVGSDIESISMITHNHPVPARWSLQDKKFYYRLKREGFKGKYALYFAWCDRVRYFDEERVK